MNNDRQPAWKMKKVLTLNCEFSLCGLNYSDCEYRVPQLNSGGCLTVVIIILPLIVASRQC